MNRTLRLLHTSDWHIGMTRRHLSESSRAVFLNSRVDAIERLCDIADDEAVDGMLVAGDVFDSAQLSPTIVLPLLELLGDVSCPVVLVPGNHDSYQYESVYRSTTFIQNKPDNVYVAEKPQVLEIIPNCQLAVAPFTSRFPSHNPIFTAAELFSNKNTEDYRVLVGHGGVDSFAPQMEDKDNSDVIASAELEQLLTTRNIDYVALGDRHSTASVGASQRIWYSGSPEVTDFDDVEKESGQALLVTLSDDNCEVSRLRTGKWNFTTLHATVRCDDDLHRLDSQLHKLTRKNKRSVRLGLKAYLPVSGMAELENYLHKWQNMFAGFQLWQRHSEQHTLPDDRDLDEYLGGYAKTAAQRLIKQAEAGDDVARDALTMLYRMATESGSRS